MAIKISRGKLDFTGGSQAFLNELTASGVKVLELSGHHIASTETLPFIRRDPFDRMIISTALACSMTILTADENITKYDVLSMW